MLRNNPQTLLQIIKLRARLLEKIRAFFLSRNIFETKTPILGNYSNIDPNIEPISVMLGNKKMFLHTSPEPAMKKLLCRGSGSIFQICEVFRNDERGKLHNPEFTMVEWYCIGMDHHDLMAQVNDLADMVLHCGTVRKMKYACAFEEHAGINPLRASCSEIYARIIKLGLNPDQAIDRTNIDQCLEFLFSAKVSPNLGMEQPVFMYDYPASQCGLAKLNIDNPCTARRFELFIKGIEICNGYHELTDSEEYMRRFEKINRERMASGKPHLPVDMELINLIGQGLPDCAGVALGFDRLVMLAAGAESLDQVMPINLI
ncbi:MAG: EF-P lysine aminoacylase EpmA [bacterium]